MASDEDKLFGLEIVEKEWHERYKAKCYMTRDFFINQRHYRWTHNMEIGDGAIARYGVLQGWPNHEGANQRHVDTKANASIVSQTKAKLASECIGPIESQGLGSPLARPNVGGVVRQVPKKPSLDTLS